MATPEAQTPADRFIARWADAAASERANAQLFLTELTDLLGVPRPGNDHALGYSFEEIAEASGMPVGTAKCHAHRGRNRLREHLEDREVA